MTLNLDTFPGQMAKRLPQVAMTVRFQLDHVASSIVQASGYRVQTASNLVRRSSCRNDNNDAFVLMELSKLVFDFGEYARNGYAVSCFSVMKK